MADEKKAVVIKPDGTGRVVTYRTVDNLTDLVGAALTRPYTEMGEMLLSLRGRRRMHLIMYARLGTPWMRGILHKEKNRLPVNRVATAMYRMGKQPTDVRVYGPVLVTELQVMTDVMIGLSSGSLKWIAARVDLDGEDAWTWRGHAVEGDKRAYHGRVNELLGMLLLGLQRLETTGVLQAAHHSMLEDMLELGTWKCYGPFVGLGVF